MTGSSSLRLLWSLPIIFSRCANFQFASGLFCCCYWWRILISCVGALCTVEMDYRVPRCCPRGLDLNHILQWLSAQTASRHVHGGETEHLTSPAHVLSIAVSVGWLLKGGVVKAHYALCSVKRCSSEQRRTAKIDKRSGLRCLLGLWVQAEWGVEVIGTQPQPLCLIQGNLPYL